MTATGNPAADTAAATTVLVVEDDSAMRSLIATVIGRSSMAIEVVAMASAGSAVEYIDNHDVGVVVTDLRMPGPDGLDLLAYTRSRSSLTQVVLVTGHATVESAVKALKSGAYDYVLKPFDNEELRCIVERALERHLLATENQRLRNRQRAYGESGEPEWGTASKYAAQLFYLLQSRAWELMFGAILALGLVPRIDNRWLRAGLALLGVSMIAFSVAYLSSTTPFPGLWATIPCLGAMLVIHTGQQRDTPVYRLLSLRPLVFIGLISYSLYLWHWPVFAFAENYLGRPIALGETLVLIVASIAIATASWRYVERPFRYGTRNVSFSQRTCFAGALGALGVAAFVGGAIYLGDGLQGRLAPETLQFYLAGQDHNPLRSKCLGGSGPRPRAAASCTKPALKPGNAYDVLVWGDSHGDALFPAIAMIGEKRGLATRQVTKKACAPLLGVERVSAGWANKPFGESGCSRFNAALLQELKEGPRPNLVVIAARWSMYTETTTDFAGGRRVFLVDDRDSRLDIETSRKVLARAVERTIDAITALGIRVLLIGQPPEFFQDPNTCYVERSILRRDVSDCLRQPRYLVDEHLHASKEILRKVSSGRSATTYVSLDSILCDDKTCRTWEDNRLLYENKSHIGLAGARVIGKALAEMPELASIFVTNGGRSVHAAAPHQRVH